MKKFFIAVLVVLSVGVVDRAIAASFKVGGAMIPNGTIPGITASFTIPVTGDGEDQYGLSPIFEYYKGSGLKLMFGGVEVVRTSQVTDDGSVGYYVKGGGGFSRMSYDFLVFTIDLNRALIKLDGGLTYKLNGGMQAFGEVGYIYTLGSGTTGAGVTRDLVMRAGIKFGN